MPSFVISMAAAGGVRGGGTLPGRPKIEKVTKKLKFRSFMSNSYWLVTYHVKLAIIVTTSWFILHTYIYGLHYS